MTNKFKVDLATLATPQFSNAIILRRDSGSMVRLDFTYVNANTAEGAGVGTPILITEEHARNLISALQKHLATRDLLMVKDTGLVN
jgi:hypothetical protein